MANNEIRVPLHDVRGVPTFLTQEHLDQWLKDNKIDVQEDWGGRPSVDVPTAWRIKAKSDAEQKAIEVEQRKRQANDAIIHTETARLTKLREDTFYQVSQTLGKTFEDAERAAWTAVAEEVAKLPKNIAGSIVLPQGHYMQFG